LSATAFSCFAHFLNPVSRFRMSSAARGFMDDRLGWVRAIF
jgi:hypothetical protein